uniref:Deoxycytidine triphosphate deaminase n=1 Tax=Lygus hesperus TaxID=30085 RepID=A0A0A9XAM3_LYGHE
MEDLLCPPVEDESNGDASEAPTAPQTEMKECPANRCSESTIFGPTLDETIIYLLGMVLPEWMRIKIGLKDCESGPVKCDSATTAVKSDFCTPVEVEEWLRTEYLRLSREVAQACMNTNEATRCPIDTSMLEARRYVLNRLAELMEKKQMVEAEYRSRCMKGRGDCNN